mmetsp:Transcript_4948/g.9293  ORF Transcript_4948/g.9293 Transcript_4948/m.9293 type:complete len:286 (+) Transcript_4948:1533-2390(+)
MSSLTNLYDNDAVQGECARLSDVIAQTDLQGRQLTRAKTNFFKRSCRSICACLTPKRAPKGVKYSALPPQAPEFTGKNTLVLDLDETLVHSSFIPTATYDFIIPVNIEGTLNHAYVAKRPGVDEFLEKCLESFEVVIFTASLKIYAEPLIERLIPGSNTHKLYRPSCRFVNGIYVKDLSRLGRTLERTVIVDNSPSSYALQPQNAVAIKSWFCDPKDNDLEGTWKILEQLVEVADIPKTLASVKKDLDATIDSSNPNKEAPSVGARGGFNSPMNRGPISFSSATA